MRITLLFSFIFMVITAGSFSQPVQPVEKLDIHRYLGLWYDIAAYRGEFHRKWRCITTEYDVVPNKKYLSVTNRWIRFKGSRSKIITAEGKAYCGEGTGHAKIKIQYSWPFKHEYYIIGLADDYSWVVISHPKRKHLWILSRDPALTPEVYDKILELIANKGFDVNRIAKTPQNCDIPK